MRSECCISWRACWRAYASCRSFAFWRSCQCATCSSCLRICSTCALYTRGSPYRVCSWYEYALSLSEMLLLSISRYSAILSHAILLTCP
ncbi:hypothetical protein [Pleurochrysis sp. endemic virus 1a]|nr:hypothetical protein [Pleurochrysis sp. endemic virus 1a]